ncbi:restriction endonuclease [Bacillus sp. sid0103]|uniref:restriction endonuclease n=1 Tax=Bacillus sp. sid0103 TaxID=2856337 RepID=UPI001C47CB42|nr:restriction endonuclease [Bacillus sp. sid0103]MBV7507403.1 restriction endonuclease [Bacillus sp. sid0103]
MYKLVRKFKKNLFNKLLVGYFIIVWYVLTIKSIFETPSDVSTGVIKLLMPFFFALTYKPFRTLVFDLISITIKAIRYKSGLPIDIREIDNMDGFAFEHFLKPVFERQGYLAQVTQGSGDYGADLILRKGRKKFVVQAKRYSSNIGVSAVQQVVAAVNYYDAHGAIVVTNQYFTPAAVELAKVNGVKLIDRDSLGKMLL